MGAMMSRRALASGVLLMWALAGCAVPLPRGESGSVAMVPFWNREIGFQGVYPGGCQEMSPGGYDCTALTSDRHMAFMNIIVAPVTMDELMAALLSSANLEVLPESIGSRPRETLMWDLYQFETTLMPPPEAVGFDEATLFRVDLALASGQTLAGGPMVYMVALAVQPEAYSEHQALFGTIFEYTVNGLGPSK